MASQNNELLEEIRKLTREKQLLELQIERENITNARKSVQESAEKRRSERILSSKKVKSLKPVAHDSIRVPGLNGTLGTNILRLGEEITIENARSKYFSYLSKNGVLDISNSKVGSQLNLLGGRCVANYLVSKYSYRSVDDIAVVKNPPPFSFNKINGSRDIRKKYEEIDIYRTKEENERILKDICRHILNQFSFKAYVFTDKYLEKCSEQSLNIKFWGPLFEAYFGRNERIFLQWGDTIPDDCKTLSLVFKIDLRIILEIDKCEFDGITGELAKKKSTTKSKLYKDKLKSVLAVKCHLNKLIASLPYLPVSRIKNIYIPIVQIMGLDCHIFCLSLVDKNVYILQDIYNFKYPRTLREIKAKGIEKVLAGLSLLDEMISDMEDTYYNYSANPGDNIKNIIEEKKSAKNIARFEECISDVIWDEHDGKYFSEEEEDDEREYSASEEE